MKAVPLGDTLDRRHGTKETRVQIDGCAKSLRVKGRYEIDGSSFEALLFHVQSSSSVKLNSVTSTLEVNINHTSCYQTPRSCSTGDE